MTLSAAYTDTPRSLNVLASPGELIAARIFEPEGAIVGNVLIHPATACPQRVYARFARSLTASGLRVITYDYRGVGASRPRSLRSCDVTMAEWAQVDARAMHRYVAEHFPTQRLAVVGHSFGAQLIGLIDEVRAASAAVFVGGQLGYCGHWAQPQAAALATLWRVVVPAVTGTLGYLPAQLGLGEDLPRGVARQWARWCSHPMYLMSEFPEALERYARFDRPILAYNFKDDSYAPKRAVTALHRQLCNADITHKRLDPRELGVRSVGHFGFFRQSAGGALWQETAKFLLEQLRAAPVSQPAPAAC